MKRIKDERITRESYRIFARMYFLMLALTVIVVFVKLFYNVPLYCYWLEIIGGGGSFLFLLVRLKMRGLLLGLFFKTATDEAIEQFTDKTKGICGMFCFFVYLFGAFVMMLLYQDDVAAYCGVAPAWMIPALVNTPRIIKRGVLAPVNSKAKRQAQKTLKITVPIGSLAFGLFIYFFISPVEGVTLPVVILTILGMACAWGIPFYVLFRFFIKRSEKNADKALAEAESEADEP